jgi:hypothetical protein
MKHKNAADDAKLSSSLAPRLALCGLGINSRRRRFPFGRWRE